MQKPNQNELNVFFLKLDCQLSLLQPARLEISAHNGLLSVMVKGLVQLSEAVVYLYKSS